MAELRRLEVWCRNDVEMVLVAVVLAGTYSVVMTTDAHVVSDILAHGEGGIEAAVLGWAHRRPSVSDFGFGGAAEKYAARVVMERGNGQGWERLYRGPLTMAAVPEDYTRWPTVRETMAAADNAPETDNEVQTARDESALTSPPADAR